MNNYLSSHGGENIPFMPTLWDEKGELVATTVAEPPYAHELTWICGSAVGSTEEFIRV